MLTQQLLEIYIANKVDLGYMIFNKALTVRDTAYKIVKNSPVGT